MKKIILLGLLVLSGFSLTACEDQKEEASESTIDRVSIHDTKKDKASLLKNSDEYKFLATNNGANKAQLIEEKSYKLFWSDNSWPGVNCQIDEVSVLKVSEYKNYSGKEYQGFVIVHYVVDNSERDITLAPEIAKILTNTGEQSDGQYDFGVHFGELLKGSKTQGYAAYPLTNLDSVGSIHQIRIKFSGNYNSEDYTEDNFKHDYDITMDLV